VYKCHVLVRLILNEHESYILANYWYFIVIDDVWSEEAWKTIEGALIDNNLGSRIILTTRNVEVAKSSSIDGAMYPLDPLSDKDSKTLLSIRIFNEGEESLLI
jgi:hypothetical protein